MSSFDDDSPAASALRQVRYNFNETSVRFQITDLNLALSFLDRADASRNALTVSRNRANAREALRSVKHFLKRLEPNAAQQAQITERLALLHARLGTVGSTSLEW